MTPQITVQPEDGGFRLYVTSYGRTVPAGARLMKGGEVPYIAFSHATKARADADAKALRQYLAGLNSAKPSKTEARKNAATFQ
jgi:hypothetical protein